MSGTDRRESQHQPTAVLRLVALAICVCAGCPSAAAFQTQPDAPAPRYKIPVRGLRVQGGFVNLVEGEAELIRADLQHQTLKARQPIENGDTITTSHAGRTEILLTPAYFLRLGNDSRVAFVDLSPGNLKLRILKGSAIVEVAITDSFQFDKRGMYDVVTVSTPLDQYAIATGGAYRFKVNADGSSSLKVHKGLAMVSGSSIRNGMFASVLNGRVDLLPADKQPDDPLDTWSRDRSLRLVQANKSLKRAKWFRQLEETRADVVAEEPDHIRPSHEARTVSALPGFVMLAETGAMIKRGGAGWEELKHSDSLGTDSSVRTPIDCRVDIRPYPDVDLLLDGDTEINYVENVDGKLTLEVLRGAIVIVPQYEPGARGLRTIELVVRKTRLEISRSGFYRVNALVGRAPEVLVYEGEGKFAGHDLKGPKKIALLESGSSISNFNRSAQDSFAVWAEKRSQTLSAMGRRQASWPRGGIWFVVEGSGEFTFVPTAWEYQSPYGGAYSVVYAANTGSGLPYGNSVIPSSPEFPSAPVIPQNPSQPKTSPPPPPPR